MTSHPINQEIFIVKINKIDIKNNRIIHFHHLNQYQHI
jgi:hypothetical protein